jgi:HSP20 family protein
LTRWVEITTHWKANHMLTSFDAIAEFDRIAQRTFGPARTDLAAIRMDAIRRPEEIELRLDLPGIDIDSLDVTVDRGVLNVSAQRSEEYGEDEKLFIRQRAMGKFTRRVRLSDSVDSENIAADYEGGVLKIRVPLQEKAQPRKVEVKAPAQAELPA